MKAPLALPLSQMEIVFLQLAAVIRATFALFLLNFSHMLKLVDSYLHDFIWPQCLLLWLGGWGIVLINVMGHVTGDQC